MNAAYVAAKFAIQKHTDVSACLNEVSIRGGVGESGTTMGYETICVEGYVTIRLIL